MDFLASGAIMLVGILVFLAHVPIGFFGALARSAPWRWGVLLLGLAFLALASVLASGRADGQPAVVHAGRAGGSEELADSTLALGGLWLRSMLLHAGMGIVVAWLLVVLVNLRSRRRAA